MIDFPQVFAASGTLSNEIGGFLGVLAEYGVLAVLLGVFIWRDIKRERSGEDRRLKEQEAAEKRSELRRMSAIDREKDMVNRLRSLEDKHADMLSTLCIDSHRVIADNTIALGHLTEALKARPCISPDDCET